jgi:hypothetical protein
MKVANARVLSDRYRAIITNVIDFFIKFVFFIIGYNNVDEDQMGDVNG